MNTQIKLSSIVSILVIILISMFGCSLTDPPQEVVRNFFKSLGKADCDTAKSYCTGRMADGYIIGETLDSWCEQVEEKHLTVRILNVDLYENEGTSCVVFQLHIFHETGVKEVKLSADLVKREGKWLIDDIKST